MGITGLVGGYTTIYTGDANRVHNVQLVANLIDHTLIRARPRVLVQRDDGRAERRQGVPRGAGDHQRRARDRARRRRVPGLDDRVQRRLRGRSRHHGAHEPRALHQPLPAGPRRDGQLPRHRPEVRERHEALAAPADVRRVVVADGEPLRRAAEPARRVRGRTARGRRQAADDLAKGPTITQGRRVVAAAGLVPARRRASTGRSTTRRARSSTTTPGTRPTAARRRSSSSARSRSRNRSRSRRRSPPADEQASACRRARPPVDPGQR